MKLVSLLAVSAAIIRSAAADPTPEPDPEPDLSEAIEVHGQAPHPTSEAVYAITRDEARALPGSETDALAAVRSMPGIGYSPAVAAGRLVIRGGAPQDSLLEIDGVPVPFIYHAFDNTTILPTAMVGAISYSPGGFGVDDGRATSGRVEILTRDDPAQTAAAEGALSTLDGSARATVPLGHGLTLDGGVRRSTVDLLIPIALPASSMVGFSELPQFYDGQLRLDWIATSRDRVALLALTSFDRVGIVQQMTGSDLPPDYEQHGQFGRLIATWKHDAGAVRNRLVAAVGADDLHAQFDTIQHVDQSGKIALLRDDLSVATNDLLRIRAGVFGEVEHLELDARSVIVPAEGIPPGHFQDLPLYTFAGPYEADYGAAYFAADATPTATTTISAGFRLDYFAHLRAAVTEPRIQAAQRLGQLTLHAAAGIYARDPSQIAGIATDLLPERATQYSAGADVDLGDGLDATTTAYRTERTDLVVDDPAHAPLPFTSTGSGSSTGVDLMLRMRRDHVFSWIAYSYGKTRERDNATVALHPTAFDQTHTLTAVASYHLGTWSLGARFQYATGLPYTEVVGASYSPELMRYQPMLGAPYGARYPDAAQLDLRIERAWTFSGKRIAAFIDAINVFRDARVQRYSYSADYSSRVPLAEFVPLPSIGVRGEM